MALDATTEDPTKDKSKPGLPTDFYRGLNFLGKPTSLTLTSPEAGAPSVEGLSAGTPVTPTTTPGMGEGAAAGARGRGSQSSVPALQTTMRILGLLENFFPGGGSGTGRTEGAFQTQRAGEQMPAELSALGLSPEEYAALRETLGAPTAAEVGGLMSKGDLAGLADWIQRFNPSELLTAGGGISAEGAATAAREGLTPGVDAGGWGAGLPAGVYAAITALLNEIAGEPASSAFLGTLGGSLGAGIAGLSGNPATGIAAGAAAPIILSLLNAFGLDRESPYQMTREGDQLRMSARLPLALYGLMSARTPSELVRVLQEQEFSRKDQSGANWGEADLIRALTDDPTSVNVLTGNYHLDEGGIDRQINQLLQLAALQMKGGEGFTIPGWAEVRGALEEQVFSNPAVMQSFNMPGYGGAPARSGDPWSNYATIAQGPTTWFGDPYA